MFWIYTTIFVLLAGWLFERLHHERDWRITLPLAIAMVATYGLVLTSRTLGTGATSFVLVLPDFTIMPVGVRALMLLLKAFDRPLDPATGGANGGGNIEPKGPEPMAPVPAAPPPHGPEDVDWAAFDRSRHTWERQFARRARRRIRPMPQPHRRPNRRRPVRHHTPTGH